MAEPANAQVHVIALGSSKGFVCTSTSPLFVSDSFCYTTCREEADEKSRMYSPAQEAARRAAADEIMKQNVGWFAQAFQRLASVASSVIDDSLKRRVGSRKRSRRWSDPKTAAANGATIPKERALVPVMVRVKH